MRVCVYIDIWVSACICINLHIRSYIIVICMYMHMCACVHMFTDTTHVYRSEGLVAMHNALCDRASDRMGVGRRPVLPPSSSSPDRLSGDGKGR